MTARKSPPTVHDLARAYYEVTAWEREPEPADELEADALAAHDSPYQRWLRANHLRDLSPAEVETRNARIYAAEAAASRRADERADIHAALGNVGMYPPSVEHGPRGFR